MTEKTLRDVRFDGESISDGFEAVQRGVVETHPKKNPAKNGYFWVFLTSKSYFMRSERFQNGAGKCSICYCAPVKKSEKNSKN